jgi:glycosyltransferase involved in cell wall biosynthesis
LNALRDYSLSRATLNVALGELMASRLRHQAPRVRVEVVHNWADGRSVRPVNPIDNRLRRDWALGDRFVVAYSGNMGRAHEFETILQACERLRQRHDIVFLFIGAGAQRAPIEAQAASRGLANLLFFPFQPREHLAMSLSAADVHLVTLHPALEGLIVPSKFYGIAAAGRPTLFVGDRRGEIARILEKGGCGISVETGDAGELAAAIERMSVDREGTAAMGRRARCVFEDRFDAPRALARWEFLLKGLGATPDKITDVTAGVDSGTAEGR